MSVNIKNQLLSYASISYIGEEPSKINETPIVDAENDPVSIDLNNRLNELIRKETLPKTPIVTGDTDPESIDLSTRLNRLVHSIPSRPAKTSTKGPLLRKVPREDVKALVELHKRHLIAKKDNVKPFPKRTIEIAKRVGKLSTDKLRALSINSFMQIVDLISKEKAKELLSDPKLPLARRAALRTFNPHVQT